MRYRHMDVGLDKNLSAPDQENGIHKRMVDTNMAITYLPGCVFLVKAAMLLTYLTYTEQLCMHTHQGVDGMNWDSLITHRNQTIVTLDLASGVLQCSVMWRMVAMCCLLLYCDGMLYQESVFNGNGLLWTIMYAFFLNQVHHVDDFSKVVDPTHHHGSLSYVDMCTSLLYIAISAVVILEYDYGILHFLFYNL
jgi:hypothetical protein